MKTDSLPSLNVIYQTDTEIKGASTLTLKKCQKLLTFLCYLVVVGGEFNLQVDKGNVQAYLDTRDFPSAGSLESCDLTAGVILLCLREHC